MQKPLFQCALGFPLGVSKQVVAIWANDVHSFGFESIRRSISQSVIDFGVLFPYSHFLTVATGTPKIEAASFCIRLPLHFRSLCENESGIAPPECAFALPESIAFISFGTYSAVIVVTSREGQHAAESAVSPVKKS